MSQKLRVLIVDDYEDGAEILGVLLEVLGFESRTAHSGRDALQLAAQYQPEIVLLDISLPDATGYELAPAIRERLNGDHAYLVALTALGRAEDRERSFEAGFDQHVVKPLDLARLTAIMTEAVGGSRRDPRSES